MDPASDETSSEAPGPSGGGLPVSFEHGLLVVDLGRIAPAHAATQRIVSMLLLWGLCWKADELRLTYGADAGGPFPIHYLFVKEPMDPANWAGWSEDFEANWITVTRSSGKIRWELESPPIGTIPPLLREFRRLAGLDSPSGRLVRDLRIRAGRLDGGPIGPAYGRFLIHIEEGIRFDVRVEEDPSEGRLAFRFSRVPTPEGV